MSGSVVVLGSYVADISLRTPRLPAWGETVLASTLSIGPGGKGSNQAVAAARAGAAVTMLTKIADDAFGQMARTLWGAAGIELSRVIEAETPTGAAAILLDQATGENAIVVAPGACYTMGPREIDAAVIRAAMIFLTQLELPIETVMAGLRIAREAGVTTILNPAPAPTALPDEILALTDYLIPNESEAATLTGLSVAAGPQAAAAAAALMARGAKSVVVTLGAQGSLLRTAAGVNTHVPAFHAGPVVETTGAGDAFCGAFAAALARGLEPEQAARFASAAAAISVTRAGAAKSMPTLAEIDFLLSRGA